MLKTVRRLPYLRILAIAQLALQARRHLRALTPAERHRMSELGRRGRSLTPAERAELRELVGRLEPRLFAGSVADAFSPIPLSGRVIRGPRKRR